MSKRRATAAERESELAKLDLLPRRDGNKRADDLLRTLLNSPPDPKIAKPKATTRAKRAK